MVTVSERTLQRAEVLLVVNDFDVQKTIDGLQKYFHDEIIKAQEYTPTGDTSHLSEKLEIIINHIINR